MQPFIHAAVFLLCLNLGNWDKLAAASDYDEIDTQLNHDELAEDAFEDSNFVSYNEHGGRVARSSEKKRKDLHQYYMFHGWRSNMYAQWINDSSQSISQHNASIVYRYDWSKIAALSYGTAARAVKNALGRRVGRYIIIQYRRGNVDLDKLNLIGHGLGAHIAGIAGKTVFRKLGKKVARIIGASPAGRSFHAAGSHKKLHKDDANCVAVIHTDQDNLGYEDPIGALDFFANGGRYQPGCYEQDGCSHNRAGLYLAEAFNNSKFGVDQPNAPLVPIDDTQTFISLVQGDCSMGNGNYNFNTNSKPPFLRK